VKRDNAILIISVSLYMVNINKFNLLNPWFLGTQNTSYLSETNMFDVFEKTGYKGIEFRSLD